MAVSAGTRLGPYEVLAALGSGGMGVVYRARDTRLGRDVAVKVLPAEVSDDSNRLRRFEQEARATAALNHPNILAIYDVGTDGGTSYVVSELLEGATFREALSRGPLPVASVIEYGAQVASGLAAAHAKGIVHRDLKPENLFATRDGRVKILDFGLAKVIEAAPAGVPQTSVETHVAATEPGTVSGTMGYMSPEQLRGDAVDHRTDLFAVGIVLYEMLTGRRPFQGNSAMATADAILHGQPDFADAAIPVSLGSIVRRLLEKDPVKRYGSADAVLRDLKNVAASAESPARTRFSKLAAAGLIAATVAGAIAGGWLWRKASRERWARETATVEIARLIDSEDYIKAAAMTLEARAILPQDPALEKLWMQSTAAPSLTTEPSGADVFYRAYRDKTNAWHRLGSTPLKDVRIPRDDYIFRIAKAGFADYNIVGTASLSTFTLIPQQSVPEGMVPVRGNLTTLGWPFGLAAQLRLDDFLVDRHEVTNAEYKKFVDAGGYENPEFWAEPFVRDGRTVPWQQAIDSFRDATGRRGPASWEVGTFPRGKDQHPVAGVSWYEAAAYARFMGKSLPTMYHWTRAAQTNYAPVIAPGSNFLGSASQAVGAADATSGFGTADMAGNVKEWCVNESLAGKRLIGGGGFGEPSYMFNMIDALSPWERRPNIGFRCVKLASPPSATASARLEFAARDVWKDDIVSDEVYAAFKRLYSYDDDAELHARVDDTKTIGDVTVETVSFDAAYGEEQLTAYLFLPKHITPPLQVIVYVPSANALLRDRFDAAAWLDRRIGEDGEFLLESGRAVIIPVIKGTWERRDGVKPGGPVGNPPALWRDHVIMWSKDVRRTLDYLQTRPDIDMEKVAYFGFSLGGAIAAPTLATEPRLKVAILSSGGQWFQRPLPEVDPTNFVTRITLPVLMLNARYDSLFPVETAQLPIFRRLGTAEKDRRHIIYEAGHGALPRTEEVRETLDWLDRYLGPVRAATRQ